MIWLVLITVVFAVLRFIVPVSGGINEADVYKDLAHIWVGVLFGYALAMTVTSVRVHEEKWGYPPRQLDGVAVWPLWGLAIGLTVVEVVAFFVRKSP